MDFSFLSKTALFRGCPPDEIPDLLRRLACLTRAYKKGSVIYHAGDTVSSAGVVLSGSVQIESVDLFGSRSILGIAQQGDVFAESYAILDDQPLVVDVTAREDSDILFLNISDLLAPETEHRYTRILVRNLLRIAAHKNLRLSMRILHSSPRKIRAKLYSYFSEQITLQGSVHIRIPLDRQQLADYLGTDRTALSKELGKMRNEGLLDFHKNEFWIHGAASVKQ